MRIAILLLAALPVFASTHIVDSVYLSDGITPATGRIVVQGYQRNANGKTALTSTITVPIVNGAVDFTVEGGTNVYFQATVYITTADGKTVLSSYKEPVWTVPNTGSTLAITDIRAAAVPANLYLKAGTYCISVTPPTWSVTTTGCTTGGGTLFDSATGLFDSASGLFDAH